MHAVISRDTLIDSPPLRYFSGPDLREGWRFTLDYPPPVWGTAPHHSGMIKKVKTTGYLMSHQHWLSVGGSGVGVWGGWERHVDER